MIRPNFIAAYLVDPKPSAEPLYLLLKRSEETYLPGIWQIVTGKVDEGEAIHETAFREILEETGLDLSECYNVDVTMFYEQPKDRIAFSANFCAYVNHEAPVKISPREHSQFEWCNYAEACRRLAFPAQVQSLTFIHHHYVLEQPNPVSLIKSCKLV